MSNSFYYLLTIVSAKHSLSGETFVLFLLSGIYYFVALDIPSLFKFFISSLKHCET
jgi:hypothetical protein